MISNLARFFMLITLLIFSLGANPIPAFATDAEKTSENASKSAENAFADLEQALTDIKQKRKSITTLQEQIAKSDGLMKKTFETRLDKAWLELLEQGLSFAEAVAGKKEAETAVNEYRQQAINMLSLQINIANSTIKHIQSRVKSPDPKLSPAELAAADIRERDRQNALNQGYDLLIRNLELSRKFEIDIAGAETSIKQNLGERAADRSVFLEIAMNNAAALRAGISTAPDDAELKARLTLATKHVQSLAAELTAVLGMMDKLEMDTSTYQEQVLGATGEITTDVFEVSVITNLLVGWGETLWNVIIEDGPDLIFKILLFFVIVYVFRKLANIVKKLLENGLEKSSLQLSELLRRMVVSIVRNIILVLGVLIALSQVGISLGPLLAGLGVVGFVIGFALQDTLSNFASGLMILTYRPYDVGDLIDTAGVFGTVSHMSLVNTTVMTLDNQTIVIPNNKIWGDVIKNVTAQTLRRVDMKFGISYSDDIPKAEQLLQNILESHDKVLTDPEPMVRLHELGDSSVNFIVRPWVNRDDYWDVYWDVTRSVKMRFDEETISIPFPQRDVHLYNQNIPASTADQSNQKSQSSLVNQDNPNSQDAE